MKAFNFDPGTLRKRIWEELFKYQFGPTDLASHFETWVKDSGLPLAFALISEEESVEKIKLVKVLDSKVSSCGFFDMAIKKNENIFPSLALVSSLKQQILKKTPKIDIRQVGFVAGGGLYARVAIQVLLDIGFREIIHAVDSVYVGSAESPFRQILNSTHRIGIQYKEISPSELLLLPSNGAVLINTSSLADSELLVNLSYLNFLSREGLVVDMGRSEQDSNLIQESRDVGISVIDYDRIILFRELHILEKIDFEFKNQTSRISGFDFEAALARLQTKG